MTDIKNLEFLPHSYKTIISNDDVEAVYYPEIKLMHFIWKRSVKGDPYRETFSTALDYAANNLSIYFLSDLRKQGIVSPDDRKWFEENAMPQALKVGLKKSAAIIDGNIFKLYYINTILNIAGNRNLPVKLFKTLREASDWLLG